LGLRPRTWGLHPRTWGLHPRTWGLRPRTLGLRPGTRERGPPGFITMQACTRKSLQESQEGRASRRDRRAEPQGEIGGRACAPLFKICAMREGRRPQRISLACMLAAVVVVRSRGSSTSLTHVPHAHVPHAHVPHAHIPARTHPRTPTSPHAHAHAPHMPCVRVGLVMAAFREGCQEEGR